MFRMFFSAWRYRFFILSSIKIEFRARFVRSHLGGLWMILQPLSQVMIFAFILSAIMSAKLPGTHSKYSYPIYLMAGILGWTLFVEILTRCLTLFIDNSNFLKKLAFPKITLPLIVTGSAIVNNILLLCAILVIFGILGHWPNSSLLWLPVLILINVIFALGLGLTLGVLNVFMRDIGMIVPIVLQVLFWFTPIVYMISIIPMHYRHWLELNPIASIINGYQEILLYGHTPHWAGLSMTVIYSILLLIFSLFLFRKASPEIVDLL